MIGPLDDIVVVALALRYAGRQVAREVILTAWPGDTRLAARPAALGLLAASGRHRPARRPTSTALDPVHASGGGASSF